ncbi:MAG: CoA transferase [Chloroflexi bacterium]|nr:CoA transferase [Chloroflexota bacterium]
MSKPLDGILVLDLSRILSGPFCTMLLADLGAEVIKAERPGEGDPARRLGPQVDDDSSYFISVNRGKKSITLDLTTEDGKRLLRDLLPHFDVLVENYVPGTTKRLGIDYAAIRHINPQLVYTSISGFGQDGPVAQRPALDIIVQAMGGILSLTGEPGGPPLRPGASLGDSVCGLFAALSIVAALYQRKATGRGQHIDMAMLDCQVTMLENAFARYFATGQVPGPLGSRHPAAAPFQAFRSSDGYFVVALITDDVTAWRRLCEAIDRPDLGNDPRFGDNRSRMEHCDILATALQQTFQGKPTSRWLKALSDAGVPCGPVNNIEAVTRDPQVLHRSMIVDIPHRSRGCWHVANTPFKLSDSTPGPAGPSPDLGEHSREVLQRLLNLSDEELGRLRQARAI